MAQETIELKTFKRLSEDKVALDGLIWTTDPEKANVFKNEETGHVVHSIVLGGIPYFPMSIDNRKRK
jgi:hypothetical protein